MTHVSELPSEFQIHTYIHTVTKKGMGAARLLRDIVRRMPFLQRYFGMDAIKVRHLYHFVKVSNRITLTYFGIVCLAS